MKRHTPMTTALEVALSKISDPLPTTLRECQVEYQNLQHTIKALEQNAMQHRRDEQAAQLESRLKAGEVTEAKAIRTIMIAEDTKEMWRQLKALRPNQESGISSIEVPTDGDFTTANCKQCQDWNLLTDPIEIEKALICRNRPHFGQAHGTFPTQPPFSETIDWAASSPSSDDLLVTTHFLPLT